MNLISTLKEEHKKIIKMLDEINPGKNEGLNSLKALKEMLVVHLDKEDSLLYPGLVASSEEELKNLGKTFQDIMKSYMELAMKCCENLNRANGVMTKDLIESYNLVKEKINNRIVIEESILFTAYEKFINK